MRFVIYWGGVLLGGILALLTGSPTLAAVLAIYPLMSGLGPLVRMAGYGVPASRFERLWRAPEFGGLPPGPRRWVARVAYEAVCHFGLYWNDPRPMGRAVAQQMRAPQP